MIYALHYSTTFSVFAQPGRLQQPQLPPLPQSCGQHQSMGLPSTYFACRALASLWSAARGGLTPRAAHSDLPSASSSPRFWRQWGGAISTLPGSSRGRGRAGFHLLSVGRGGRTCHAGR